MSEDRSEMLERHGRCDVDDRRPRFGDCEAFPDPPFELGKVISGALCALVERVMLAAVDRLLRRERLDLFGEARGRSLAKGAYALDEIGFPHRKSARQSVVNSCRFDASAVPQTRRGRIPAE